MRNLRTIAFILMITLSFTSCKKEYATLSGETEFLLGTWVNTTPNQPISKIIFERKGCYIEYSKARDDYMRYGEIKIKERVGDDIDYPDKLITILNMNKKDKSLGELIISLFKENDEYNLNQIIIDLYPFAFFYFDDITKVNSYFKKQ